MAGAWRFDKFKRRQSWQSKPQNAELAERQMSNAAELWADASHELRQPLQALLLLTHTLRRQKNEGDRETTVRAIEIGLTAIHEMLEFLNRLALVEVGQRRADIRKLQLASLYGKFDSDLKRLAETKQIKLRHRPWKGRVIADACTLQIVLHSLVSNAIDSAAGGEVLHGIRPRGNNLLLEVYFKPPANSGKPAEQRAFTELRYGGDHSAELHIVLGMRLIAHACRLLGHDFESRTLDNGWQRLRLGVTRA